MNLKHYLIRFSCVGVVNTLFGAGLYSLFIYLGMSYKLSVLLSTVIGVFFNFKTTGFFVFRNRENRLIIKFVLSYIVIYFINISLIKMLIQTTPFNEYMAGIVVIPIVALMSFLLQNFYVFKENKKENIFK